METTKTPQAPNVQVETKEKQKRTHSKTWEAAMRLKGSLIVNDPAFLL